MFGCKNDLFYNMKYFTCEKDVGMGLCTFNFVLRLSLHLVCLLFGTSSLHLFDFLILLTCFIFDWAYKIHVGKCKYHCQPTIKGTATSWNARGYYNYRPGFHSHFKVRTDKVGAEH